VALFLDLLLVSLLVRILHLLLLGRFDYLCIYIFFLLCKGTQMAQSRYLFALSCFQMDLLNEAESALCPVNEPGAEVFNVLWYFAFIRLLNVILQKQCVSFWTLFIDLVQ